MLNTIKFWRIHYLPHWLFKKKNILILLTDQHFFVTPKFSELEVFQPYSIIVSKTWFFVDVTEDLD